MSVSTSSRRRTRVAMSVLVAGALLVASFGSASADKNCIGWYASEFSAPGEHGPATSWAAQEFGGLGRMLGTVAPACSGQN